MSFSVFFFFFQLFFQPLFFFQLFLFNHFLFILYFCVYFIIIKTEAQTMLDFKEKKAVRPAIAAKERTTSPVILKLNEEKFGWYECVMDFKRVLLVPGTGKFQYRDTRFVVQLKGMSGIDCYNRIVDHLRERVDERSQFPSAKGKNFRFTYLGMAK